MPFRRTRIAHLNQQVDADFQKKGHRAKLAYFFPSFLSVRKKRVIEPYWPTFLSVSYNKQKTSSSQHLQTAARENFLHILHYYGQFGGGVAALSVTLEMYLVRKELRRL